MNLFKPSVRDGIFRVLTPADPRAKSHRTFTLNVKARLHRRFLSRHLDAIFVALKLQQVSNRKLCNMSSHPFDVCRRCCRLHGVLFEWQLEDAQNSRNCFKPFFSLYTGLWTLCGEKNYETFAHMLKNTFTAFPYKFILIK